MLSHANDLIFTNDSKTNSSAVRPVLIQVSAGQLLSLQSTCQHTLFSKEALGQQQKIAANVGAKLGASLFLRSFVFCARNISIYLYCVHHSSRAAEAARQIYQQSQNGLPTW